MLMSVPRPKTDSHAHAGTKPMSKRTSHKSEATRTHESETPMKATHAAKTESATHAHESKIPMKATHASKTAHVHASKTANLTSTTETESAHMTTPIEATLAAPTPTPTPTQTSTSTSTAPVTALPYIKAPPPITLPPVPAGVVTVPPAQLRGQLPRKQELELMPAVESEIDRFVDFASVFGKTAPSQAAVEQTLTSAFQWSMLHVQLSAWQKYAQSQEVAAWVNARSVINRLAPAFALAVKTDSSIGVDYPSLGNLFGVRSSIAKRAAAVRKANAVETDSGLPAYKGEAGKRRKKAAAKAALAAQQAAPPATATAATVAPVVSTQPVVPPPAAVTVAPPAAAPSAPVAATPPAAVNVTTVGHA